MQRNSQQDLIVTRQIFHKLLSWKVCITTKFRQLFWLTLSALYKQQCVSLRDIPCTWLSWSDNGGVDDKFWCQQWVKVSSSLYTHYQTIYGYGCLLSKHKQPVVAHFKWMKNFIMCHKCMLPYYHWTFPSFKAPKHAQIQDNKLQFRTINFNWTNNIYPVTDSIRHSDHGHIWKNIYI